MNRIDEHFAALESEEVKSRKAVRKFRNRVIVGSVIVPAVKWSLIAIGTMTVIGCVTKSDKNEETEEV